MQTIIIVHLKRKLISLDNILPLLFELHAAKPLPKLLFAFPNRQTYWLVRKNIVLWDIIHYIGGKPIYLYFGKSRWALTTWKLRSYLYRKVISVETTIKVSRLVIGLTMLNRRIFGGKRVLCILTNIPSKTLLAWNQLHVMMRASRTDKK